MDKNIKQVLEDLYAIDSSLKKYEKELTDIINKLIASKPRVKFDESFKNQLRAELLEKFSTLDNKKNNFNFMNKIIYVFGSLALVLLILIPTLSKNQNTHTAKVNFNWEVEKLNREAFGPLLAHNTAPADARMEEMTSSVAIGLGGGGGGGNANMAYDQSGKMIAPAPTTYKYVYQGEEFSIDGEQMAVLKKIKGLGSQGQVGQFLQSLDFNNIDLSGLDNVKVRNFTMYEDKNFGYSVNVDLYEGMISINENWEKWPMYQYPMDPINIEDVPSDETLINMANKFVQERGISLENYGAPIVDNAWRFNYLRLSDKSNFMIPDMTTVIYPLVIDGKAVYEEWGTVQGLRVAVNLRHNKVSSMWNLSSQKYQSSLYDMETNVDKILELAARGGNYYYYPEYSGDVKVVEVPLGTPRIAYMQTWQYVDNVNNELLVPALIFPILELPEESEYFYKENVVIPLPKEILDQRFNDRPEVYPVDLSEPAIPPQDTVEEDSQAPEEAVLLVQ